jgi:hypothetical protein
VPRRRAETSQQQNTATIGFRGNSHQCERDPNIQAARGIRKRVEKATDGTAERVGIVIGAIITAILYLGVIGLAALR